MSEKVKTQRRLARKKRKGFEDAAVDKEGVICMILELLTGLNTILRQRSHEYLDRVLLEVEGKHWIRLQIDFEHHI